MGQVHALFCFISHPPAAVVLMMICVAWDSKLSVTYDQLLAVLPNKAAKLRTTQRRWLKARDQCDTDSRCISSQYESRIEGRVFLFAYMDMPDQPTLSFPYPTCSRLRG